MMHSLNQTANVAMDPPFHEAYKALLGETAAMAKGSDMVTVEEWELPVVDLSRLKAAEAEECKNDIIKASKEWGFFQVVNHGISNQLLGKMRAKQIELFKQPFERKSKEDKFLNFSAGSYRWGTPSATSLTQLSWSEAFHVSLSDILGSNGSDDLRSTMEEFAGKVSRLAQKIAEILGENLDRSSKFFVENCVPSTCYLRMNRYPPCPVSGQIFGLMPHTDSDFLTILHQDQVGGLELVKDGKWIAVKPNPEALIINIGDLFQIDDVERLREIVKQAAKEGAMLVYTLADPFMAESAKQACKLWGIQSNDILGPLTEVVASHLGVSPSGLPRGAFGNNIALTDEYFRRIEAIEFTIKQDDGALPQNLNKADIVLAGVSRTGKTPLSIYLAQKGYKVANVPIVMGINLPKNLFEADPEKVFGLTINPIVLQTIRRARAKSLGFSDEMRSTYSEMDFVREELDFAGKIFAQNPTWPVIEVTGKAIEETAAVILRLYHDRKHKCSMPRISKRY